MHRSLLALVLLVAACGNPGDDGKDTDVDSDVDTIGDTQIADTQVIDTDVGETDVGETDTLVVDTEVVDTEVIDTDTVETDTLVADTDVVDTEVPDTDTLVVDTDTTVDTDTLVVDTDTTVDTDTLIDTDTGGGIVDGDGDGYPGMLDCDDADPTVNPDALERCNSRDDDCDGRIDIGAIDAGTWFADGDDDGFGDDATAVVACELPDGHAALGGDCDDAAPTVNPGAQEVCDPGNTDEDCDGTADDADASAQGLVVWYSDADGDGFGAGPTSFACDAAPGRTLDDQDCDDGEAGVHPGADEVCNDRDDDCDDVIDDGALDASVWYADADDDGFGDAATTVVACSSPAHYVASAGDCDDAASAVNPAAVERCDVANVDEDCDGLADNADPTATGRVAWHADADGDTFGASASVLACDAVAGQVLDDSDCDDAHGDVHPGATEVCNDRDDDCDAAIDEDAVDRTRFYADADSDLHGDPASSVLACDQPLDTVTLSDDCDDADPAVNPDATEACNDKDDDCDGATDEAGATGEQQVFADVDGDTWGDPATARMACTLGSGQVRVGGDCDDAVGAIHPGADEVCNDKDDDCDGAIDESPVDGTVWYRDADNDAFGAAATTQVACSRPVGFAASADDCDDTRAAVNPAASERCSTPYDDDCDGTINEDAAVDAPTWYSDADNDGFGTTTGTAACEQPADTTADHTDCDDTRAGVYPGAPELCDGMANDCVTRLAWLPSDEDGMVTLVDPAGHASDVTSTFTGFVFLQGGRYDICRGEYHVRLGGNPVARTTLNGVAGQAEVLLSGLGAGRVLNVGGSTIVAQHLQMVDGFSGSDGGVVSVDSGYLELKDVHLGTGVAVGRGGGLWVGALGYAKLADVVIDDSQAASGGGVAVGGTLVADLTSVTACTASGAGGGLWAASDSDVTLTDTELGLNEAANGAGLYLGGGQHLYTRLDVHDSLASVDGGGLYAVLGTSDSLRVVSSTFAFDEATRRGGGVYLNDASGATFEDVLVDAEIAGEHGGAFAAQVAPGHTLTLTRVTVDRASADGRGGGLWLSGGAARLEGCSFTSGQSTGGGGVYASASDLTVIDSSFDRNAAFGGEGGGLWVDGGRTTITGGSVLRNQASLGSGGGLSIHQSNTTITDVGIGGNTAEAGGGIYAVATNDLPVSLLGTTRIAGNQASQGGGVYLASGLFGCGDDTGSDVGIVSNVAPAGGGLYVSGASGTIFSALVCDMGVSGSPDDNGPLSDIALQGVGTFAAEDDETFVCVAGLGCF